MTSPLLLKMKRFQLGFRNLDLKDGLLVGPHLDLMTLLSQLFVHGPQHRLRIGARLVLPVICTTSRSTN